MKLGLYGINIGRLAKDPALGIELAVAAEAAGWDSVWTGEHFALPDPPSPDSPAPPDTPMLDPWTALAAIATRTTTLLVATGVTVVPLYEPVALAKQAASLDRLSGGRFLFGVGVGYLTAEFEAFGASLSTRGRATDQALDVLRELWSEEPAPVDYLGRTIGGLRAEPRPLTDGGPPIHVAGYTPASFRRAVRRGHGWYGWALDLETTRRCVDGLRRAGDEVDRPAPLGALEVTVTPSPLVPLDRALVDGYAALGVDRLVAFIPGDARGGGQQATDALGALRTELTA